ncbi:hypothetical protein B566_EDAN006159 [Ephemera danica]|nr:hypothetical protein B566_EDAN006159 [Ephemera danica]
MLLNDIKNIAIYYDDVFLKADSELELWSTIRQVLQVFKDVGLRLKASKCSFCVTQLEVLGYSFSSDGLRPADSKMHDLIMMRAPQNREELQSLLGYINYYDRFLKDRASIFAPLYVLLEAGTTWEWGTEHQEALDYVKQVMSSDIVLVHYDEKLPLVLACDASSYGVGAVLSHLMPDQSERPISHASRTLRDSEKNYAQIDREGLSIVFGVRKFHMYLYGRSFTIITDHKPLLGLFRPDKPLPDVLSPRIVRWVLLLSNYQYTLQFRPGSRHGNADLLSRIPRSTNELDEIYGEPRGVLLLDETKVNSPLSVRNIEAATKIDPVLSAIYSATQRGGDFRELPASCKSYLNQSSALNISRGCLLLGNRVIVPSTLRNAVLKLLHKQHQGMTKMKLVARSYVWWPRLDNDIEELCGTCEVCCQTARLPPKATPMPWSTPPGPWRRIHIDFAGPDNGKSIFIAVDAFSHWIEAQDTGESYSAKTAIVCLRGMFATHGIPDELVSDNAPAFRAEEFRDFMDQNLIIHIRVVPYQPASNGLAERAVQTIKSMLHKVPVQRWKYELPNILLALRSTPSAATGRTPAELMFGRNVRTLLDRLHPYTAPQNVSRDAEAQQAMISQPSRVFAENDVVWYRNYRGNPKWLKGTVIKVMGPRNYEICTDSGDNISRHVDQMRRCAQSSGDLSPYNVYSPLGSSTESPEAIDTNDNRVTRALNSPSASEATPRSTRSQQQGFVTPPSHASSMTSPQGARVTPTSPVAQSPTGRSPVTASPPPLATPGRYLLRPRK